MYEAYRSDANGPTSRARAIGFLGSMNDRIDMFSTDFEITRFFQKTVIPVNL